MRMSGQCYLSKWTVFLFVLVPLIGSACMLSSPPKQEPQSKPNVTGEPNQPPVITSLTIDGEPAKKEEPEQIKIWITKTIECIAEDPDGDQLRYTWSATGGKIQRDGAKIGWTPGQAGNYKVIVTVTDDKGGEAQAFVNFEVYCCK